MTLALLCGFRAEEKIATTVTGLTAIGWHNPGAAGDLIAQGATTLISFGIAGALDPALRSGDLLLPESVLVDGAPHPCSPDLHRLLRDAFPAARTEPLVYSPHIVTTAAAKQRFFAAGWGIATDMESGLAAQAALAAGVPFAVLRTVSDEADDDLPPAALAGLTIEGEVDYLAVIASLLRQPRQLPALIRTGRQSRKALDAVEDAAPTLKQLLT